MRHYPLFLVAVSAFTLVACGGADSTGSSGDDLSTSDCQAPAQKAHDDALNQCLADNASVYDACMKPAYDALQQANDEYDATLKGINDQVDAIVARCLADANQNPCTEASSGYAQAACELEGTSGPAAQSLKKHMIRECELNGDIAKFLGDNFSLKLNELGTKIVGLEYARDGKWVACEGQNAARWVARHTICPDTGDSAFASKMKACRRECPDVAQTACTPDQYKSQGFVVMCGKWQNIKDYDPINGPALGLSCESGAQCTRTGVCDDFDKTLKDINKADGVSTCADASGAEGVEQAQVILADNGSGGKVPDHIDRVCVVSK
jgi:hypothetical protein